MSKKARKDRIKNRRRAEKIREKISENKLLEEKEVKEEAEGKENRKDWHVKYLPQIYRFFSAKKTFFWIKASILILVLGFLFYNLLPYQRLEKKNVIKSPNGTIESNDEKFKKMDKLEKKVNYWEKVVEKRTDYRDAYLELSILNYQLNRLLTAKSYFEKAKEIDPNFPITLELERLLGK